MPQLDRNMYASDYSMFAPPRPPPRRNRAHAPTFETHRAEETESGELPSCVPLLTVLRGAVVHSLAGTTRVWATTPHHTKNNTDVALYWVVLRYGYVITGLRARVDVCGPSLMYQLHV